MVHNDGKMLPPPFGRRPRDEYGRKVRAVFDDWIIEKVLGDGTRVKRLRTHDTTTLGKDHTWLTEAIVSQEIE
jgi:hypothetical protein